MHKVSLLEDRNRAYPDGQFRNAHSVRSILKLLYQSVIHKTVPRVV
jgi:hypothetical protein